jgi:hypothetical protein
LTSLSITIPDEPHFGQITCGAGGLPLFLLAVGFASDVEVV